MTSFHRTPPPPRLLLLLFLSLTTLLLTTHPPHHHHHHATATNTQPQPPDGQRSYERGTTLFASQKYTAAAKQFWKSIIHKPPRAKYSVEDAFGLFLKCYALQNRLSEGYSHVARQYLLQGDPNSSRMYAKRALDINKHDAEARRVLIELGDVDENDDDKKKGRTAARVYDLANTKFDENNDREAARLFEESCQLSEETLYLACTNAVFCRMRVADWGPKGRQFEKDMKRLVVMTMQEINTLRVEGVDDYDDDVGVDSNVLWTSRKKMGRYWDRMTSAHPHMMLGYPIEDMWMKRMVAESYSDTDAMYGAAEAVGMDKWRQHLKGFPVDQEAKRKSWRKEFEGGDKIRVAFVSGGINSKAVMFLAHDFFRYYDKSRFEVHVFSTSDADNPLFIQKTMRGVDWRQRVMDNADYFHDAKDIRQKGPAALARYVISFKIHILVDWDGYCRNGIRPQGLYDLRPAPVQIMHQEFLGTGGGQFDFLVTDQVVSPREYEEYYAEKFIYMPHHFFSKGHAVQDDVPPPKVEYNPPSTPYKLDTGSPQENKCGATQKHPEAISFVFCNFNKFLKFNPDTVRTWVRILESTPDSLLCLLRYPAEGMPNILKFVKEINPEVATRVHFLSWENNPFDHIVRNRDHCNLILDSHPYNGHTTTMDALYSGIPVVTRSDGKDMGSRVTTSANIVLGLEMLNAKGGWEEYAATAIRLAKNQSEYDTIRRRLIQTCLMTNPMHPFWDMKRYVRNLERGFEMVWEQYLEGKGFDHVEVREDEEDAINYVDHELDEDVHGYFYGPDEIGDEL